MTYPSRHSSGPPTWFIFLLAVAFVFGIYYLWVNLRSYLRSGGVSVSQATEQFQQFSTVTAERDQAFQAQLPTRRPSPTARPPCQDFEVVVNTGIMRQEPTTASPLVESLQEGTIVCVLSSEEGADGYIWYLIDRDVVTRRIEVVYMREDVIAPTNPTPTPSNTALPRPTITHTHTPLPSNTPPPTQATDVPRRSTQAPSVTPEPTTTNEAVSL